MKDGDIVTAITDWNLGTARITGVIESEITYFIRGDVEGNTDGHERRFPIKQCWDIQRIDEAQE